MQFVFSEHTTPLNQHRGFNLTMDGSWATVVPAASDALPRPSTAASAAGSGGVASGEGATVEPRAEDGMISLYFIEPEVKCQFLEGHFSEHFKGYFKVRSISSKRTHTLIRAAHGNERTVFILLIHLWYFMVPSEEVMHGDAIVA